MTVMKYFSPIILLSIIVLADICPISMQSVGCYNDVMQERTLPVLLVSYRKAEQLIDWLNYKSSISK